MKLLLAFMFSLFLAWGICEFSSTKLASSLANEPGWPTTRSTNSLPSPKIMITARSTSTRLPWEGSPHPSMPPSVTPSEGSSTSEGGGIQSTATPSEGSSTSEGGGIQSTAKTSDDSVGIVTTQTTSPNSSLLSIMTGRNHESSTTGSDSDGFNKSDVVTQNTLR